MLQIKQSRLTPICHVLYSNGRNHIALVAVFVLDHTKSEPFKIRLIKCSDFKWRQDWSVQILSPQCSGHGRYSWPCVCSSGHGRHFLKPHRCKMFQTWPCVCSSGCYVKTSGITQPSQMGHFSSLSNKIQINYTGHGRHFLKPHRCKMVQPSSIHEVKSGHRHISHSQMVSLSVIQIPFVSCSYQLDTFLPVPLSDSFTLIFAIFRREILL